MKIHYLLILTAASFITAAAINQNNKTSTLSSATVRAAYRYQQTFSIKCSPLYTPSEDESIPALTGWGNYQWKITTRSDSAQFYFNQGINMYYAFHIIEARASFDKATRFDAMCAMAYWGKALAYGPNINDFGYQRPSEAYPSAVKGKELSLTNSSVEKALIDAMYSRYSPDTAKSQSRLNELYKEEMAKVYAGNKSNANVGALYADALMLLHPWDLYDHTFKAKAWTSEIVKVIEHTLQLQPKHPGANHYYIHALEASAKPERALKSADLLQHLMPDVSHITHMPSHIYIRTGYYNKGITVNDKALDGYNKYLNFFPATNENIALYSLHNLHMKMNCAQMAGNYEVSFKTAMQLQQAIPAFYLTVPGPLANYVQYLYESPLFTQVRFGKWDDILKTSTNDSLAFSSLVHHFAKGMAYANKQQVALATTELALLKRNLQNPLLKEPLVPFNSGYDAGVIAEKILAGTIHVQQKDFNAAIINFQQAVVEEDKLIYNEPRDWLLPPRQYLGSALLKAKKYQLAEEVFKKDLVINPHNGWSLTGLVTVYKVQQKKLQHADATRQLKDAWIIKDQDITQAVY